MITINNKDYLNIVERVEKNTALIEQHYARDRVLAEVGVKVMGQKDDPSALVDLLPPGGAEAWGEAYLVGATEPYDIHIWTRPGEWFNIGPLNMMGDQGVPGDSIENAEVTSDNRLKITMDDGREIITNAFNTIKGNTGNTGPANSIISTTVNPDYTVTFTFKDGSSATTNKSLRGEPGAPSQVPGPIGESGKDGRSLYIKGIVPSVNELKSINPLNDLFGAYLVGTTSPYLLYIPVQEIGEFIYAGQFMGGTVITVGGQTQDTWNADTKLDKYTTSGGGNKVYGVNNDGEQKMYTVRNDPQTGNSGTYKNQIVQYDVANNKNTGLIRIAETPIERYHTASKSYVDNKFKVYQHNQYLKLTYDDESVDIYYTCYDGGVNAKGYMNTNGMTGNISGYYTLSNGHQLPILYGEIDTANSNMSVAVELDGQVGMHYFDSFSIADITDTVTRII